MVSEDHQASALWAWLKGRGLKDLPKMQVLDISWFTDSMRAGKPIAVESKHLILVCVCLCLWSIGVCHKLDLSRSEG